MNNAFKNLSKPVVENGYVKSPKTIMAYLNQGCEIRQVGKDKVYSHDPMPEYYLVAGMHWEVPVSPRHVQALETLELVVLDCGNGRDWISKANFGISDKMPAHA